jgi:hypothetical protein
VCRQKMSPMVQGNILKQWGFLILIMVVFTQLYAFVKTYEIVHIKLVSFALDKLYFTKADFEIKSFQ